MAEWRGCTNCKHLERGKVPFSCPAYPQGIPMPIASGDIAHRQRFEGQTGNVVWEPIEA